jgi:hypothetical protein
MRYTTPHVISRAAAALGLLLAFALTPGCHMLMKAGSGGGKTEDPGETAESEERAIREAFEAIKAKDRKRFYNVSITTADFVMRDNGLNDYHDQAGYAGSVQKPEEQEALIEAFDSVIRGGDGVIDFSSVSFESLGTLLQSAEMDTVDGNTVRFREYSIVVKGPSGSFDTKDLSPRFVVVPWEDGHRILELRMSEGGGDYESEPGEYDQTYEEEEE